MLEYFEGGLEACLEPECCYCGDAGMSFSFLPFLYCFWLLWGEDEGLNVFGGCFADLSTLLSSSSWNRMLPIR